jgi:hypothetical protein
MRKNSIGGIKVRIECDGCGEIKSSDNITLVVTGENSWGLIFREYLCKKCYKGYLTKQEDEDEDEEDD